MLWCKAARFRRDALYGTTKWIIVGVLDVQLASIDPRNTIRNDAVGHMLVVACM